MRGHDSQPHRQVTVRTRRLEDLVSGSEALQRPSGRRPFTPAAGSIPFSVLTQAGDGQGRRAAAKRSDQ
jgi:hypothetical protein